MKSLRGIKDTNLINRDFLLNTEVINEKRTTVNELSHC